MGLPSAWTYSRLEAFETCPRKYWRLHVKKDVVDPPNEASLWGKRVHTAFEDRINKSTPLPTGMNQWDGIADKISRLRGDKYPEYKMAVDGAFKAAKWEDAWVRGIADLVTIAGDTATVIDYKTGKRKPTEQLKLYAGFVVAHFQVDKVKTSFIWLKEKKIDNEQFDRSDVPGIWNSFLPRVARLERAHDNDTWPARPNGLCRKYCPVKDCEFNGK